MTIADIIIIYLACGSPFAVQFLSISNDRLSWSVLAGAAARCLLWPVSAVLLLYRLVTRISLNGDIVSFRGVENDLNRLQAAIEDAKFTEQQAAHVFQFRDAFMRYTGLALELNVHNAEPAAAEIFDIAEHPRPDLASICLQRRNRSRLQSHYDQARDDLIALVSQNGGEYERSERVLQLTVETAARVGDTSLVRGLRNQAGVSTNGIAARAVDEVGELWNTSSQSQSAAG